jgi:hypothetical protein
MDEINDAKKQHVESKKIQSKILKWDDKESPLAKLNAEQLQLINEIEERLTTTTRDEEIKGLTKPVEDSDASKNDPLNMDNVVESTPKFLTLYDQIDDLFLNQFDDVYLEFYNQLEERTMECDVLLGEVKDFQNCLDDFIRDFVQFLRIYLKI